MGCPGFGKLSLSGGEGAQNGHGGSVRVVAVRAVHMALGDHGDGHGAATGGGLGRSRCIGVGMSVVMIVRVVMGMAVTMAVTMAPAVARRIGTAFGLKRQVLLGHDQVHGAQHVGQHMVGLDLEVVGLQLDGHMPVAQVVGGARGVP